MKYLDLASRLMVDGTGALLRTTLLAIVWIPGSTLAVAQSFPAAIELEALDGTDEFAVDGLAAFDDSGSEARFVGGVDIAGSASQDETNSAIARLGIPWLTSVT